MSDGDGFVYFLYLQNQSELWVITGLGGGDMCLESYYIPTNKVWEVVYWRHSVGRSVDH